MRLTVLCVRVDYAYMGMVMEWESPLLSFRPESRKMPYVIFDIYVLLTKSIISLDVLDDILIV